MGIQMSEYRILITAIALQMLSMGNSGLSASSVIMAYQHILITPDYFVSPDRKME